MQYVHIFYVQRHDELYFLFPFSSAACYVISRCDYCRLDDIQCGRGFPERILVFYQAMVSLSVNFNLSKTILSIILPAALRRHIELYAVWSESFFFSLLE